MASEDEVRRLILDVIGEEKVRSLREQIDQEKESLLKLTATLGSLTPEEIARDKGVQVATIHLAEMNVELKKLEGSHRNLGYAALEASRGIEDLQYGVGGIINNIPGLVMALGGGAGLTAAISITAVAVNQLVKHVFPEWEGGVKKIKEEHEKLTGALKEQKEALDALEKAKATKEGVEGVVGAHREEMRKAVAAQLGAEGAAEEERLGAEMQRVAAGPTDEFRQLMPGLQQRFARVRRMRGTEQLRADEILGRAVQGGLPEQARLRGIFGPETEIGARLAEAGPDRTRQRERDERDAEQQVKMHRLDEQIAHKKERDAQKAAQARLTASDAEMRAINEKIRIEEHEAKEKAQAAKHAVEADRRAAAAKDLKAHKAEREGIEGVRFQAEQAIGRGVPAGLVAQQANQMLNRIARTSGMTTDLVQAQGRLMLHLQQVAERQERQLQSAQRDLERGWQSAMRVAK